MAVSPVDHRGAVTIQICAVFTGLAGLFVLLRLYTRFFILHRPGLEDHTIVFALLLFIGFTTFVGIHAQHGLGYHIWQLSPADVVWTYKAHWASVIMFAAAVPVTKISIFIQYLRVFTSRKCQLFSSAAIAILTIFAVSNSIVAIFACVPVSAAWTRKPATCINACAGYLFNCAVNIITDLACLLFPVFVMKSLNLPRRQRAALIFVFALGGVACIIGIVRVHAITIMCKLDDPPYKDPLAAVLAAIEISVSIICACIPLLRPLVTRIFPRAFASSDCSPESTLNTCITIGEIRTRKIPRSTEDDLLESKRASRRVEDNGGQDFRTFAEVHAHFLRTQSKQDHRPDKRASATITQTMSSSTEILVHDGHLTR